MRVMRSVIIAALVALGTQAAGAQAQWTWDAGVFARWNQLDNSYETNSGFGGGARVGLFVIPRLEVEIDASYTWNEGKSGSALGGLNYAPIAVRAEYFLPVKDRFAVMAGLGYAQEKFSAGLNADDWAWSGVLGVRATMKPNLYLLFNYTTNYSPTAANPSNAVTSTWNNGLELGVGYLFEIKKK